MTLPYFCPKCFSQMIRWVPDDLCWYCTDCTATFDNEGVFLKYEPDKGGLAPSFEDKKGGYMIDKQMIRGGRDNQ